MKIKHLLLILFTCWQLTAQAADLLQVYQQAQASDPIFQQAIAQRLSTKEGVPISASAILPNLGFTMNPAISRYGFSGSDYVVSSAGFVGIATPRNLTQRSYTMNLSLTQTVFNFAQFSTVAMQVSLSKAADATLNAALQNLMVRVAAAYFTVLNDEDNLSYNEASKLAYAEQLDQIRQQYKVGLKTLTDVYTAQASYESSVASYIAAQTTLANDRENLRVITGVYYPDLATLRDNFPLVRPKPLDVDEWIKSALENNWSIKASQYNTDSARRNIQVEFAGHLPTVNVQGAFTRQFNDNISGYNSFIDRNGPGMTVDRSVTLNLNVPLFSGGGVVARTNQATYDYQVSDQQLEQTVRNTVNTTRQSYMNIIAGISKIAADKQAIKSSISSLEGIRASYQVGTETLVDVLNQQKQVFQAQTQYATDRYAFVNNLLALKQAAGTLSFDDLRALNSWLTERKPRKVSRKGIHVY